ncbi:MAG: glycosyl transferase, partial [Candidatus Heimdallarchaeota archaeon]
MRYGYFDDDRREYVITQPDTPLPWINYLGCEKYFGIISNTAGGYSFYQDAKVRRITRYRYNNVPLDFGGRYIYLRDNTTKEFWSLSWQPTRNELDQYTCHHGLGYTIIRSLYKNIESKIRYFVPLGENLEIWQLTLKNQGELRVNLSLFSCIEFCLWDAQDDFSNFQRNFSTGEVEIDNSVIYHKTEYRERRDHFAYFSCSEPLEGYDTQRDEFLGLYRGWEKPFVVERGQSCNSTAHGWAPIGSHHVSLTLNTGETKQIFFILGYFENPRDQKFDPPESETINKRMVKKIIAKYSTKKNVDNAFNTLKVYWDSLLGKFQVNTPNIHTDRMVNIWNAYQCMVTFNLSRSASFFESGIGRGIGFRDSNQDLLGFIHMVPERARERILDLAATQLKTGGAFHQYQPLTKRGNDDIGSDFNDDPLWLILSVAAYLKETGDYEILNELVVYENQPGTEEKLLNHLERCLRYTQEKLGPHELPLIGRADWNDCLNLNCFSEEPGQSFQTTTNKDGKVAESVFIAALFLLAAKEYIEILKACNLEEKGKVYLLWIEKMKTAVSKYGWDGEWFLRAYDDFGDKVGSHVCQEGRIFIESQGFCIL